MVQFMSSEMESLLQEQLHHVSILLVSPCNTVIAYSSFYKNQNATNSMRHDQVRWLSGSSLMVEPGRWGIESRKQWTPPPPTGSPHDLEGITLARVMQVQEVTLISLACSGFCFEQVFLHSSHRQGQVFRSAKSNTTWMHAFRMQVFML